MPDTGHLTPVLGLLSESLQLLGVGDFSPLYLSLLLTMPSLLKFLISEHSTLTVIPALSLEPVYLCLCCYLDTIFGSVELNIALRMCRTQGSGDWGGEDAAGKHMQYGHPEVQKGMKMAYSLILASSLV